MKKFAVVRVKMGEEEETHTRFGICFEDICYSVKTRNLGIHLHPAHVTT